MNIFLAKTWVKKKLAGIIALCMFMPMMPHGCSTTGAHKKQDDKSKLGGQMVKEIKKDKTGYFACEKCGLLYKEKTWAEKCQQWCAKNESCNIEIIRHAVGNDLKK